MKISTLNDVKLLFNERDSFTIDESFELSKVCSTFLKSPEKEYWGREIAIRALDNLNKFPNSIIPLWNDIIEMCGLYPYVDPIMLDNSALLRFEFHKSKFLKNVYLHEEQLELSQSLLAGNSVILSAPTSFGKSLLIEEIVASGKYRNLVIIQPTLALLDETRKKLFKYRNDYNIIVSTSQSPKKDQKNIYLFTGERVVEYQHFSLIDFFVIDEFYKLSLSRNDDRAVTLNQAFHKLLKHTPTFYLLGPVVKSIPIEFEKKLNVNIRYTNFSTVAIDEIPFIGKEKEDKEEKKERLFHLLFRLNEPTLIYCSAPEKAASIAAEFSEYIKDRHNQDNRNADIIEWIEENIHDNFNLKSCLAKGVAFHNGVLPRHLGSSIVDAFNLKSVKYLFCTSTLIEGVNTMAKNIVLFDNTKGNKIPIDFFDYKNIAGRSGRMRVHYTGRIFKFYDTPQQLELEVDIPFITQTHAPVELLIQLESDELKQESKNKMLQYDKLDPELLKVIRSNNGISVDGQVALVKELERNIRTYSQKLVWTGYPKYQQLLPVIELAWKYLMRRGESKANVRSPAQLATYAVQYSALKSIKGIIDNQVNTQYWITQLPDDNKRINKVAFNILNASRHWFDYKLPKLLTSVSKIQSYVFSKHKLLSGDYTFFASAIENGFMDTSLSILLEYDVPMSALNKLKGHFPSQAEPETILATLKKVNLRKAKLNNYEIKKIMQVIG